LLLLPCICLTFAVRALVDRAASTLGRALAASTEGALAFRTPATDTPELAPYVPGADAYVPGLSVLSPLPAAEGAPPGPPGKTRAPSPPPPLRSGIRVRADVVARAVQSGVRPTGTPVPGSGMRPAGLVLHGVSGYGAGLRDGDVLTRVAGAPATSVGAVVGAVAGALHAKARMISGEIWRGDQRLAVAVEIPVLAPARPQRGSTPPK
jgi:hypothetical protein